MKLNTITVAVLILGAIVTLVALLLLAGGGSGSEGALLLLVAVWALIPNAVLFASCRLARTRGRALATLIVSILATAWAAPAYIVPTFDRHPGDMTGLNFIFVPLFQLPAALILLAVVFFTRARNPRST